MGGKHLLVVLAVAVIMEPLVDLVVEGPLHTTQAMAPVEGAAGLEAVQMTGPAVQAVEVLIMMARTSQTKMEQIIAMVM